MYHSDMNADIHFALNQPHMCDAHASVLLLVVIHTTFSGADKRSAIRETWGARKNLRDFVPVLFFIPTYPDGPSEIQMSIEKESLIHKDIIQSTFSSENSFTTKLVIASVWIKRHCSQASYILMIEDFSVVDIFKLVPYLKSLSYFWNWSPIFLCDYISPHEVTFLEKKENSRPYCGTSAFLTTPVLMERMASTVFRSPGTFKDAWLSEIADASSVAWTNTSQYFIGSRQQPSILNEFSSSNYPSSPVMIALVLDTAEDREAIMIRHMWRLMGEHQDHLSIPISRHKQLSETVSSDSSSILAFAFGLMFVDFLVVALIFVLIFCKRKRKNLF